MSENLFPGARPKRAKPAEQPDEIPVLPAPTTLEGHTNTLVTGPDEDPELVERKARALASLAAKVDRQHEQGAEQEAMLRAMKGPPAVESAPVSPRAGDLTIQVIAVGGIEDGDDWHGPGKRVTCNGEDTAKARRWIAQGRAKKIGGPRWLATTRRGGVLVPGAVRIGPRGDRIPAEHLIVTPESPQLIDFEFIPVKTRSVSQKVGKMTGANSTSTPIADIQDFATREEALAWSKGTPPAPNLLLQLVEEMSRPFVPTPKDVERAERRARGENEFGPNLRPAPRTQDVVSPRTYAPMAEATRMTYECVVEHTVFIDHGHNMMRVIPGQVYEAFEDVENKYVDEGKARKLGDAPNLPALDLPPGRQPLPGHVVPQPSTLRHPVYTF
jgi:hypothetical protein